MSDTATKTQQVLTFRCLEGNHHFDKVVDASCPAILRQSATCPVHHSAAVRHAEEGR